MLLLYSIIYFLEQLFHSLCCLTFVQHSGYSLTKSSKYKSYTLFVIVAIPVAIATLLIINSVSIKDSIFSHIACTVALLIAVVFCIVYSKKRNKYKLTSRSIRLLSCTLFIAMLPLTVLFSGNTVLILVITQCAVIIVPIEIRLVLRILNPFEDKRNEKYIERAKKKLDSMKDLIVVAITGSYGKTSCKNILRRLLSGTYNVYATEKSYNTPMGIAKSIHSMDNAEVFIVEFGARHFGDIDELLSIIKPQYGIIVGVAPQHLETFGSLDNIYEEKAKLATVCKTIVIPSDDRLEEEVRKYDAEIIQVGKDVRISNVAIKGLYGASFVIEGENTVCYNIPLLGKHNVENMALCVAMATELGVKSEQLQILSESLPYLEHRMEPIFRGGVCIIDDGYNANIDGVKAAAEFLSALPGRKICVLQGIVECGNDCVSMNSEIGEIFASFSDLIFLVGINSTFIEKGIKRISQSVPVKRFSSLNEVKKELSVSLLSGDTVYLQNDLGDLY